MRKILIAAPLIALLTLGIAAQKQSKPWSEWSEKDADKLLTDSAWAQTQTDTNTSEMTFSPTSGSSGGSNSATRPNGSATMRGEQSDINRNRAREGAYNRAVGINYRIRFLSARPIREAIANAILRQSLKSDSDKELTAEKIKVQMQSFIDRDFGDYIAIAVTYDAEDGRLSGKAFQEFNAAVPSALKNNTYLERTDGKRVFLIDYRAPVGDGLGARFVFPRVVNGGPFLKKDSGEVRFYSEVGPDVKLNRRFKVSDMVYQGKLEY